MQQENAGYFTEREEEFVNILTEIGTRPNVARVLVFFARTMEATSRDVERGTGLRQPEVSTAMRYLREKEWVRSRDSDERSQGRPIKIYELAKPLVEIMDSIEKEKTKETDRRLQQIQTLWNYILVTMQ